MQQIGRVAYAQPGQSHRLVHSTTSVWFLIQVMFAMLGSHASSKESPRFTAVLDARVQSTELVSEGFKGFKATSLLGCEVPFRPSASSDSIDVLRDASSY